MLKTNRTQIKQRQLWLLLLCLADAALTCLAQIRGGGLLLYAALLFFLALGLFAVSGGMSFSFFLFFLPWSPLLKLYNGAISFYTIALLLSCFLSLAKSGFDVDRYHVILPAILLGLTLIGKAIQGNSLTNSYLFFFIMLFLFPCVVKSGRQQESFYLMTICFSIGIISAALIARQAAAYPNISRYITVQSYAQITRLSGFFGDPNFYSAHITAAIAALLLLISREANKRKLVLMIVIAVILIYCGLLSASKMFVMVIACIFVCWIPMLFRKRGGFLGKFSLLLGILCAGIVILTSVAFQELFKILNFRFSYASNLSQLTTGRTELWSNYLKELFRNVPLLLHGEGYSQVVLDGRASHNTLIQLVYQFGLYGSVVLTAWEYLLLLHYSGGLIRKKGLLLPGCLLLAGIALPWLSLDILFFDEFFLLPVYGAAGMIELETRE